ncbi:MAG: carboxypeptidase-like regulatory domain-containing protein, partial [Endomicrobium sp.]|nr:carboxypeptidase-like regulatory domain-containing protein [Endomicrobium sp.]
DEEAEKKAARKAKEENIKREREEKEAKAARLLIEKREKEDAQRQARQNKEEKQRREKEEKEALEARLKQDKEEKENLLKQEKEERSAAKAELEKASKEKKKEKPPKPKAESSKKVKTVKIRGTVSSKYSPVSGINLTIEPGGYQAETDEKGRYFFNDIPENSRYIIKPYSQDMSFEPENAIFEDVKSNITQDFIPYISIEGETFYEGKPISDVAVFFNDVKITETNKFGKFRIYPVEYNSQVSISVSKAGYPFYPLSFSVKKADKNYDGLKFFVYYTISGKITMSDRTSGLSNAEIEISGSTNAVITTDFSGNFSIQGLEAGGTYKITPKTGGYKFVPSNRDYVLLKENHVSQNFTAAKEAYNITGSVTIGGKPVKNATISITRRALKYFTDNEGNFEIKGLDYGGPYTVTVQSKEHQYEPIVIDTLKEDMKIEFSTDLFLSGVVMSDGRPIPGVTVDVNGSKYKTDENGRYTIKGLKYNGAYLLSLQAKGLLFDPFQKEYSGLHKSVQNEVFEASVVLSGRITSGGRPLEGAEVVLGGIGMEPKTYKTDANGYYTISGAKVGRDYYLEPQLEGYSFTPAKKEYVGLSEGKLSENFKAVEKGGAAASEGVELPASLSPQAQPSQQEPILPLQSLQPSPKSLEESAAEIKIYSLKGFVYNAFQRGVKGAVLKTSDGLSVATDSKGAYKIDGLKSGVKTSVTPQSEEYNFYPEVFAVSFKGNSNFNDVFAYPKKIVKPVAFIYGGTDSVVSSKSPEVEIVAVSNESGKISVQVINEKDNPVSKFEIDSQANKPAVIKWDLALSSKKKVPAGEYTAVLNGAGFYDEIVSFKFVK